MPVTPRPASTVVLMRDRGSGRGAPEVLMVERHQRSGVLAGAYVFPGGMLETQDCAAAVAACSPALTPAAAQDLLRTAGPPAQALGLFACAIRETFEEVMILLARESGGAPWPVPGTDVKAELAAARTAICEGRSVFAEWLGARALQMATDELKYFAHWITPESNPWRFDTRFFLAAVPEETPAHIDGTEISGHRWLAPSEAIALHDSGRMHMITPTRTTLEQLAVFSSTQEALAGVGAAQVQPILPKRIQQANGECAFLHPWDEGYEDA